MRSLSEEEVCVRGRYSTPTFLTTRVFAADSGFSRFGNERVLYRQTNRNALRDGYFTTAFFENALHFGLTYALHRGTTQRGFGFYSYRQIDLCQLSAVCRAASVGITVVGSEFFGHSHPLLIIYLLSLIKL